MHFNVTSSVASRHAARWESILDGALRGAGAHGHLNNGSIEKLQGGLDGEHKWRFLSLLSSVCNICRTFVWLLQHNMTHTFSNKDLRGLRGFSSFGLNIYKNNISIGKATGYKTSNMQITSSKSLKSAHIMVPLSAHNPACLNTNQQHFVATDHKGSSATSQKQFQNMDLFLHLAWSDTSPIFQKLLGLVGTNYLVFWLLP